MTAHIRKSDTCLPGEAKDSGHRTFHIRRSHEGAASLNPHRPARRFNFLENPAGRGVAHAKLGADLILGGNAHAWQQPPLLDLANDLLADRVVFWQSGDHNLAPGKALIVTLRY